MPFNTLRQNLNMLARRDVFSDREFLAEVAAKLAEADGKVFPYQLFTTFQNTTDLPSEISNALQDAAEVATRNVPQFGDTLLFIDVSGSMRSPVTGNRMGEGGKMIPASKTSCVDVAGLMGACVLRNNKNATVISFDTSARVVRLNARDSIMTNALAIANSGNGGTDLAAPMKLANQMGLKADLIIYVSDNESWAGRGYGTAIEWQNFKKRNSKAKLVNIDIQPYAHSQLPDNKDVLNIGGFSDAIWPAIAAFANEKNGGDFVSTIEEAVSL
jgi:60 kDa SS-A/Ro ribonucleoprotein